MGNSTQFQGGGLGFRRGDRSRATCAGNPRANSPSSLENTAGRSSECTRSNAPSPPIAPDFTAPQARLFALGGVPRLWYALDIPGGRFSRAVLTSPSAALRHHPARRWAAMALQGGVIMSQQEHRIHISDFCALVYKQQEDECARNFDDAAAEAEWSDKPDPQQSDIHLDSIASANVYEGFDDKARPIDAVPAYFAEFSGIRYEDAIDYIWRAGHGCQWGGLKRVSGEVRRDLTKVAQTLSAYFKGDAMRELLDWFVGLYPQEADEMGLPDSDAQVEQEQDATESTEPPPGGQLPSNDTGNEWPPDKGLHFRPLEFAYQGKVYRLTGMRHRLFEVIATAKKNLHYNEIVERVWTSQERSPERGTVRSCLSDLRAALRKHRLSALAKRIKVKDRYWLFLD